MQRPPPCQRWHLKWNGSALMKSASSQVRAETSGFPCWNAFELICDATNCVINDVKIWVAGSNLSFVGELAGILLLREILEAQKKPLLEKRSGGLCFHSKITRNNEAQDEVLAAAQDVHTNKIVSNACSLEHRDWQRQETDSVFLGSNRIPIGSHLQSPRGKWTGNGWKPTAFSSAPIGFQSEAIYKAHVACQRCRHCHIANGACARCVVRIVHATLLANFISATGE